MNTVFRLLSLFAVASCCNSASAQTFSSALLSGSTTSSLSAGDQMFPAIAKGTDNYLVVWEDNRTSHSGVVAPPNGFNPNRDIYAARLDLSGHLLDVTPIVVNQDPFDQVTPKVAWNGTNYLVVWKSSRAAAFSVTSGIYAARVSSAGALLDATPIMIEDSDDYDEWSPSVASDGANWAVFYTDFVTGQTFESLDAVTVDPAGLVTLKRQVIVGEQALYSDVEFATDRYLVAYERGYSGAYGRMVDTGLTPIGAPLVFHASLRKPRVASNGASFFVSFGYTSGTPVALDGTVAIAGGGNFAGSAAAWGQATDCAFDGANWLLAFADSNSPASLYVSRVTPAGALAGTPIAVTSTSASVREIALADGSAAGQIVWNDWTVSAPGAYSGGGGDFGDILGAQTLASGGASAITPISVSAPAQVDPVIAGSDATGYLVAYLSLTSGCTQELSHRDWMRGVAIDAQPIVLATGGRVIRRVDVAFDGSEWLVVWNDFQGLLHHTFGRRIALDGTLLDAQPIDIVRGMRASVDALAGQRTFLVASWDHNQSTEFIRAARVDGATGSLPDAPYLTVSVGSGFPDVMGFDDRWIVVWSGATGKLVQANGTIGPLLAFGGGASEGSHGLARAGDLGLVTFRTSVGADIHGRRFQKDGTLLDQWDGFPICQGNMIQFDPRATFDGTDFVVTWSDYRAFPALVPGIADLYQTKVSTGGVTLTPCGVGVATDVRIPEGNAEITQANGGTITVACVLHSEAPFGALRIDLRISDPVSIGTPHCFGDGSGAACPCGNAGAIGNGCANSIFGSGARLEAFGIPGASTGTDSLVLSATNVSGPGLFFQGTSTLASGLGLAFGDGLLCSSGSIARLGVAFPVGTTAVYPEDSSQNPIHVGGATSAGDVRHYQCWYRDALPYCTAATFNLTPGVTLTWGP